ncbi:MAG: glycosyl transferase family 2 [Chitinophagaceae bacterium]|nr:glycosyl transferase family 2 [Chitinophagaceae bacterium]
MSLVDAPLVSVIMPAYNVEAYITQAIQSVLTQTYTHFELLISDDGSTDQTSALLLEQKDSRIVLLENNRNLGYVDNMNVLLKAAKGKYIVIQDADDYCDKNRLQVLVNFLESHTDLSMVGSCYVKVDDEGKEERVSVPVNKEEIQQSFARLDDPLPVLNGSTLFHRKIIDDGILFRHLHYTRRGQDDDWLFRVSEKFQIGNVDQYLYHYRSNSSSMTLNPSLVDYRSLFAGDYVRFLKSYRTRQGIDVLEQKKYSLIEAFFAEKKRTLTQEEPAYLELYIAHKYLGQKEKKQTLKWLLKALLKDPTNGYIWKKIVSVFLKEKSKS